MSDYNNLSIPEHKQPQFLFPELQAEYCYASDCPNHTSLNNKYEKLCDTCLFAENNFEVFSEWIKEDDSRLLVKWVDNDTWMRDYERVPKTVSTE